ncbi:uncharacterized protein LOC135501520 [Lineus longissimus]|uniref:uncharacterized protein LOC135501520 n=1 Tax=Lineus longissimus TaxID=88925 RepID=UPI002B4E869F
MAMGGIWSTEPEELPEEPKGKGSGDDDCHDLEEGLNFVVCQDGDSQDSGDALSVGDQLYIKVHSLHADVADKITGMLMECENDQIVSMLNDDSYLEEMVSRAVDVLAEEDSTTDVSYSDSDSDDDTTKEQLGEALYERVAELEPELCGHITGMLLELDNALIREFLESRDSLEEAVAKARTEYLLHATGSPAGSSSSEDDELSCILFNAVSERCPEIADRITGMLLELDQKVIEKLLDNPKHLDAQVERAKVALYEDSVV